MLPYAITHIRITHILEAQWELNDWIQNYLDEKFEKIANGKSRLNLEKLMRSFNFDGTLRKSGDIYNLFERNCKHYARHLFFNLQRRRWSDEHRLDEPWNAEAWHQPPRKRYREPRSRIWRTIKRCAGPALMFVLWLILAVFEK
jgi:hypothetical protein